MGIKSVISLLAIYFFVPSCDFPERIKLNNTQYKHFLFKDPVVCPFGASHLTVTITSL